MNGAKLGRRAALLLPLAAAACDTLDDLFSSSNKPKLPGRRETVLLGHRGLELEPGDRKPILPPPVANAAWPQAGGNPAHFMGHLSAGDRLAEAWRAEIGEGGGYRQKIMASPVAADGVVYTMDSSAVVMAFDIASGAKRWEYDTKDPDQDSTNVGGGLGLDAGTLYATNGTGWLTALDVASGKVRWRTETKNPARSAPTVAEGRLFFVTIDGLMVACATEDGRKLWAHEATEPVTGLLGQPAPTYADGFVVGAFGSGEISALRAETGTALWTDSLASSRGRNNVGDISAIRGLPVIIGGQVYAIGLGGLLVAIDLRTGRRVWERDAAGEDNIWAAGDWLFLITSRQQLACVSRLDGRSAWLTDLPAYENVEKSEDPIFWFGPVLAGDRLIVAGTQQEALAISPYSGEILGRQMLTDSASLAPIVVGGTAFVVTDDGALVAMR